MNRELQDRFRGCLLGLAVGDALGAPVEGWSADAIRRRYGRLTAMVGGSALGRRLGPGETTDDTAMMLCIARTIAQRRRFDAAEVARRFLAWYDTKPKDIGSTTRVALSLLRQGVPWQEAGRLAHQQLGGQMAGNGSIMRCAPIALLRWRNEPLLMEESIDSSLITHYDPRACWATVALNLLLVQCLMGHKERSLAAVALKVAEPEVRLAVRSAPTLMARALPNSGFVLDTLQAALWCFLHAESLEEALVAAVNLGGDADTIGAVCDALAGAYYGAAAIPSRWLSPLRSRDEISELADGIYSLATPDPPMARADK
ncbi:MAG: ADP-ribosylglycohydrolase family protein [Dehalococcoidia bacterium]